MCVGINDTYLANHLPSDAASAGRRWGRSHDAGFQSAGGVGGGGSTAIIARAKGSRHRRLANSVTGQSVTAAVLIGVFVGLILFFGAKHIIQIYPVVERPGFLRFLICGC